MWTVISLAGLRRTLHMPSSSFSRAAASSNLASAATHGLVSCSIESVVAMKRKPPVPLWHRAARPNPVAKFLDSVERFTAGLGIFLDVLRSRFQKIENHAFGGHVI